MYKLKAIRQEVECYFCKKKSKMSEKTRIDKWLWTVRLYKSRTLAADAIKEGKVKIGPQTVKASAQVGVGEIVEVRRNGFNFRYRVEKLLKTRVSAVLAQEAITNITTEEELNKYNVWFTNKMASRDRGAGRPTKKERRDLDGFQGTPGFEWLDDEDDLDDDDSDDTDDDA